MYPQTQKSVGLQTRTSSKLALACLEQTRTNTKVNLNKGLGLDFLSILFDYPSFPEPIAFLPGRPPFQNQSNHFPWDFRSFCRKNGEGTPRAKSLGAPPPFLDLDLGFLLHLFFLRTSVIWTSFLDLKWFLGVGISKLSEPLGFPKTKGSDAKDIQTGVGDTNPFVQKRRKNQHAAKQNTLLSTVLNFWCPFCFSDVRRMDNQCPHWI